MEDAAGYVSGFAGKPHGHIKVSAGIGFGVNVLSELLPVFADRYPEIRITLNLTSRLADMVGEGVDCAIRIGSLPDSSLISTRLGMLSRYLCASPAYLEKHGAPASIRDLAGHQQHTIEMPSQSSGRPFSWVFRKGDETVHVDPQPRMLVDEALTINRLILNGAGIGIVSAYVCAPDIMAGRLIRLFPDWSLPARPVSLLYPSRHELAPAVRAFADFMKEDGTRGQHWLIDPRTE